MSEERGEGMGQEGEELEDVVLPRQQRVLLVLDPTYPALPPSLPIPPFFPCPFLYLLPLLRFLLVAPRGLPFLWVIIAGSRDGLVLVMLPLVAPPAAASSNLALSP